LAIGANPSDGGYKLDVAGSIHSTGAKGSLTYNPATADFTVVSTDGANTGLLQSQAAFTTLSAGDATKTTQIILQPSDGSFTWSGTGNTGGLGVGVSGTTGSFSSTLGVTGVSTLTGGTVTPAQHSITLNNTVGRTLLVGELVTVGNSTTVNNTLMLAPASSINPIGAVAVSCANNVLCTIATGGKVTVMLKDTTNCTSGQWVGVSDVAGRAYCINDPVAVGTHNQEIGHSYSNSGNGTNKTIEIVMHFN